MSRLIKSSKNSLTGTMSKKNLTYTESKTPVVVTICFLVALVVILIYILLPEPQKDKTIEPEIPSGFKLVVSNGCGKEDLAQDVSTMLLNKGFIIVGCDNIDNTRCVYEKTLLVIRKRDEDTDKKLDFFEKLTGLNNITEAEKENARAEFELILGKDYYKYFKM